MGKHINDYCRYKDYCVESTICDDDGRDKHCIEIRVPILNDDGKLYIPGNVQLSVKRLDGKTPIGWVGINVDITTKQVTFKSQGKENSQNIEDCSAEMIVDSLLGYLEYFPQIRENPDFLKAWEELKDETTEEIEKLLNNWKKLDIDKEIEETKKRIQEIRNRFAKHENIVRRIQGEEYFQEKQTKQGVPFIDFLEFCHMDLDVKSQSEISDVADYMRQLEDLKQEMGKLK